MTSNPAREFRTDAIRPSAIQTGTLGRRTVSQLPNAGGVDGDDAADALEKEYQRWNTRIDTEMVALSSGLRELIQFANISPNPPPHIHQTTPLQLKVTTSQIIRSTQNLRDIAHDLKLALLLSNQVDTTEKRDAEMRHVREDIVLARRKVGEGIVELLNGGVESSGDRMNETSNHVRGSERGGSVESRETELEEVKADSPEDAQMDQPAAMQRAEDVESPTTVQPETTTTPAVDDAAPSPNEAPPPVAQPQQAQDASIIVDSDDEEMEEV